MISQRFARSLQSVARPASCTPARVQHVPFIAQRSAPAFSHRITGRRFYSAAPETEKKNTEESTADAKSEEAQSEDPVQKELASTKKSLVDVTDRLKRSVADYRNLQEQTKREIQASKDFAIQRFAKDLIDSIDNLDRALEAVPSDKLTEANQDLVNLHSGLKMTETILMQTLKKHGMERVDPSVESEKFDPNKHEATFQAPQQDKEDGTVFFTQQKGFSLNGRVLRAAKVGVVKNS